MAEETAVELEACSSVPCYQQLNIGVMPTIEELPEEIPIEEQIRLAQASGLLSQPSVLRRATAGQRREETLVSKIPSNLEGAELIEVDYRDPSAVYPSEGVRRTRTDARQPIGTESEQMDLGDEIFMAALYVVPLSSLYLLLDM
jgi:hypothetical protein